VETLGEALPWVAVYGISTHWLRHTTLTWVERHFGYGVARAYAGHTDSIGPATTTYIKGQLGEVATALQAMTGKPHPSRCGPTRRARSASPRDDDVICRQEGDVTTAARVRKDGWVLVLRATAKLLNLVDPATVPAGERGTTLLGSW